MFMTLYKCRARPGKLGAIRELYGKWQELLSGQDGVCTELFSSSDDPADLVLLARFPDEETTWSAIDSAEYRSWYAQLASLADVGPIVSQYRRWQDVPAEYPPAL